MHTHSLENTLKRAKCISKVILGDSPIELNQFVGVVRYNAKVEFSAQYRDRVNRSRFLVDKFTNENRIIYGVTTGLGENWNKAVCPEDSALLQRNTLLSHATSVGEPLDKEVVRGILLMMLLNLGQAYAGVRMETLEQIAGLLNNGIIPFAPKDGSVGYLGPEAHVGLVLIGLGKAWFNDNLLPGDKVLEEAGMKPIALASKEGLSLVSGTTSITALTALTLYDAINYSKTADISAAMSLEVLKGTLEAYDPRIHAVRPHEDQINTAENIRNILKDSEIIAQYKSYRVQDATSLRNVPQVHGAAKKTIKDAYQTVLTEMNSCCDNPLIFSDSEDDGQVLMGCNADGSFVGIEADSLCMAMTMMAKMSERRTHRLVNPHVSELPAFLIRNNGVNHGFMIPQYTSAGIVGQMRIFSHPATIDNAITSAFQEDYTSMGYNAALKAYKTVNLLKYVLAIELMCAAQAQDFIAELLPSPTTLAVKNLIRKNVPFLEKDEFLQPYIEHVSSLIAEEKILDIVENLKY
ncbi:HAL/PAL/TAL family ammonia-lyase [Desulfosporosinus youngiae]|uniref:Histidine ammonia-lyase n=1 Tax=Desulfosporosinus youngiae DSM 17734 TaxID=768710 RepID=H5Y652_9FIRM|nr:aromatic amino acid ammonia-lyase [Desulfosporosinus youngiae]EHQ91062.1 histidine ammonia-lyase [Desulfosporosinus youngiae DSM 17734]